MTKAVYSNLLSMEDAILALTVPLLQLLPRLAAATRAPAWDARVREAHTHAVVDVVFEEDSEARSRASSRKTSLGTVRRVTRKWCSGPPSPTRIGDDPSEPAGTLLADDQEEEEYAKVL